MKVKYITTLFFFSLYSTVLLSETIKISSIPIGADILLQKENGEFTPLGTTPYEVETTQLTSMASEGKLFNLKIKKQGFKTENFVILGEAKESSELNIKLNEDEYAKMIPAFDSMISQLFTAQKFIRNKSFADALTLLQKLEKKHQNFSVIYELKGITYYMQKDIQKSLTMFRHAYSLNKNNIDSFRMKTYIEKELGLFVQ